MTDLVYNNAYAWQKTDALPFSPEDIITQVDPAGAGQCPANSTNDILQVEKCRNKELGEWYINYIANADAAPQQLRDISVQYEFEWIRSLNFAVGIVGLSMLCYRLS